MKTKLIALFLTAAILLSACGSTGADTAQVLTVSGVIEVTQVAIASQLSGRVQAVFAKEGDPVNAGEELIRLEDDLLQLQQKAASAAVVSAEAAVKTAQLGVTSAQTRYDLALSAALAAMQPDRIDNWTQAKIGEFALPAWYFSTDERLTSTDQEVVAALTALEAARTNLENIENKVDSAPFVQASQRLSDATIAYQLAEAVFNQTSATKDGQELYNAANNAFGDAKIELENARKAYDEALTTAEALDVLEARAKVRVAQEHYNLALDTQRALQTGARSPEVLMANQVIDQAQAVLEQAQSAVYQAQAQLALVEAQIKELSVYAPLDGVVLTRSIEPGEVLQAGLTALTIARLDALSVTVYIPENRYGEVKLGQHVALKVDSFPGETFTARVTRIADQAEFTPQNVQTTEGRQTTV
ncbi:MAG: efflux RND transporter periplasmic adaptor subunit, partial [Chloroflexota bacterium]